MNLTEADIMFIQQAVIRDAQNLINGLQELREKMNKPKETKNKKGEE